MLFIVFLFASWGLQAQTFTLTSKDLGGQFTNAFVLNGFGCNGGNLSPQLSWTGAPQDTKSFAVTMHDPAAPTGSGWWHWVVFDIPSAVKELKQGAGDPQKNLAPAHAVQSITDFGKTGYGGPCPPAGDAAHPYMITIYALNTDKLGLDQKATPALVGFQLHQHVLAKASLLIYYKR
jgi:hypothetical protein